MEVCVCFCLCVYARLLLLIFTVSVLNQALHHFVLLPHGRESVWLSSGSKAGDTGAEHGQDVTEHPLSSDMKKV